MPKNFFLGVGAEKSGTTWLYQYLSQCSNFDLGPIKEYHIWDTLYTRPIGRDFLKRLDSDELNYIRYNLVDESPPYEQYFSGLIRENINSTGDITPAYCQLRTEHYSKIKRRLEDAGFDVKIIFLMRDPYERCSSAARMIASKENITQITPDILTKWYATPPFQDRTNYKSVITEVESVFLPEQIYYGIYEEMFTKEKIDALSEFCGVTPNYSYASVNNNPSKPFSEEIDPGLKKEIIHFYSDIYKFCHERFPQTKLLWNKVEL